MTQITYSDGTTKNFSETGKAYIHAVANDTNLNITVYFNQVDENNVGISTFTSLPVFSPETSDYLKELAIRGAKHYISSSINLAKAFSDTAETVEGKVKVVPGTFSIVQKKISELALLSAEVLVARNTGESVTRIPLNRLQLAYAKTYSIDVSSDEGYKTVLDWYNSNLESNPEFKKFKPMLGDDIYLAYEFVRQEQKREKLEAAKKALESEEKRLQELLAASKVVSE